MRRGDLTPLLMTLTQGCEGMIGGFTPVEAPLSYWEPGDTVLLVHGFPDEKPPALRGHEMK